MSGIVFGNPAAVWGLSALPAIVAIHFLQRRARTVPMPTLFLLEKRGPRTDGGRTLRVPRPTLLLLLQLLAAALAVFLLADPRRPRPGSVVRAAVVLDSSWSMEASRGRIAPALRPWVSALASRAEALEWVLLDSASPSPPLASGAGATALLAAVAAARPSAGGHDGVPAIALGRSLVGPDGHVLFVTDRTDEAPPAGAERLAVGEPAANVGFLSAEVVGRESRMTWRAVVRNAGPDPARRVVTLSEGAIGLSRQEIELSPGAARTLEGAVPAGKPAGSRRLVLALSPEDPFPLDDRAPLLRPEVKRISFALRAGADAEILTRLVASTDGLDAARREAFTDLTIESVPPGPLPARGAAIVVLDAPAAGVLLDGAIVAESDPLVDGLDFRGLLVRGSPGFPAEPGDRLLLSQDGRPLAFLRAGEGGVERLVLAFDPDLSNAGRLPAVVLLLHRFVGRVRARTVGFEARVFEPGQRLELAVDPTGDRLTVETDEGSRSVPPAEAAELRAPLRPGHFVVSQGRTRLLEGAAVFGDAAESDLSGSGSELPVAQASAGQARRELGRHPLRPVAAAAIAALLAGAWLLGSAAPARARP